MKFGQWQLRHRRHLAGVLANRFSRLARHLVVAEVHRIIHARAPARQIGRLIVEHTQHPFDVRVVLAAIRLVDAPGQGGDGRRVVERVAQDADEDRARQPQLNRFLRQGVPGGQHDRCLVQALDHLVEDRLQLRVDGIDPRIGRHRFKYTMKRVTGVGNRLGVLAHLDGHGRVEHDAADHAGKITHGRQGGTCPVGDAIKIGLCIPQGAANVEDVGGDLGGVDGGQVGTGRYKTLPCAQRGGYETCGLLFGAVVGQKGLVRHWLEFRCKQGRLGKAGAPLVEDDQVALPQPQLLGRRLAQMTQQAVGVATWSTGKKHQGVGRGHVAQALHQGHINAQRSLARIESRSGAARLGHGDVTTNGRQTGRERVFAGGHAFKARQLSGGHDW